MTTDNTTRTDSAGGPQAHEHRVAILAQGTVDPSAGAGVPAAVASTYHRDNAGAGELWLKTGATDTAWTRVVVP